MPRMSVWRPCDAVESAVAWKCAIEKREGPSSLIFSRQGLPHVPRSDEQIAAIERGGYIVHEPTANVDAIVIATGSEVSLALDAAKQLEGQGKGVRVVSMPCTDYFDAQDEAYRESVLPRSITARVAVEAGMPDLWRKYVGLVGDVLGIDTFGESGPAKDVFAHFGISSDNLANKINDVISRTT